MTGFKSFAEPAEISIDDGLTGVVGPNGCGKSNIVESLRWLMGESSAKSMRGSDLEDIVFSGTASRPSRNFAEVTLTLDNADMSAPAIYNNAPEIEITRKLERGKGSSFRINGKSVRSRDVQLLFADMATGSRSSGIVSQGKIDSLINAKPRERRNLLEEAANISGLHQRRHEAELRLNTAENNLERLEDILIQLDDQKASLQKQARQAARYRSVADRIRKADAHLLLAKVTAAMSQLEAAESQLREVERQVAAATETASAALRQREKAATELPPLRQAEAEKAAERQRLMLARNELDNEEARARRAADDLAARKDQIENDIRRENQLLDDAEKALASLTSEAGQLAAENAAEQPRLDDAATRLDTARSQAEAAEKELTDAAARSRAAEREQENLTRRRQDIQQQHDNAAATLAGIDLDRLGAEAAAVTARKTEAEQTLEKSDRKKPGSKHSWQPCASNRVIPPLRVLRCRNNLHALVPKLKHWPRCSPLRTAKAIIRSRRRSPLPPVSRMLLLQPWVKRWPRPLVKMATDTGAHWAHRHPPVRKERYRLLIRSRYRQHLPPLLPVSALLHQHQRRHRCRASLLRGRC